MKARRTNKRLLRGEKGQSLVELALTLTLVLTLLAGAVDLGSAFFAYTALSDAAQEGALFGSVKPIIDANNNGIYDTGEAMNTTEIVNRVRQSSSQPVNLSDLTQVTVSISASSPPCATGWITVSVSYNYQLAMPFVGAILGSTTIPLTASATDTILAPKCP
jgi:Flp pilus assembly protein TadG